MGPRIRLFETLVTLAVLAATSLSAWSRDDVKSAWAVTDAQRAEKNPVAPAIESTTRGAVVYRKNCLACHGVTGDGKGPVAARLGFEAGDLTRSSTMTQRTDGELFWKIATGRDPMPAFRKQKGLTDSQIWDVVNYIRTLARK